MWMGAVAIGLDIPIGKRCTFGAVAVVTKDIPDRVNCP